ncbi:nuclear receptor coactivator 2-like isoform X3 [Varanus komodoensis]|uniref:nuclear receptor coactivator 2-like isoform X3 n=1 Tax=Varanus komodoensis TaxID=61221 RepID=UPI001CF7DE7E|nr:nuclear receptor coactivator 2-like isoform X3 [Varanus komodoensis]
MAAAAESAAPASSYKAKVSAGSSLGDTSRRLADMYLRLMGLLKIPLNHVRLSQENARNVLIYWESVLRQGLAFSPVYRFSLSDGTIVAAQTKNKLIRSQTTCEPQLVISLHMLHRPQRTGRKYRAKKSILI